jgi:hypothetical protein
MRPRLLACLNAPSAWFPRLGGKRPAIAIAALLAVSIAGCGGGGTEIGDEDTREAV